MLHPLEEKSQRRLTLDRSTDMNFLFPFYTLFNVQQNIRILIILRGYLVIAIDLGSKNTAQAYIYIYAFRKVHSFS